MPKWTESQLEAIEERDKNLLVSAAAGSGKTAVLVERIKNLIIDDKVSVDRFLIVTFTNAAAGEMRDRIEKTLIEKISEDENNLELRKQLKLMGRSSIKTLHSFCLDVIRNNFSYLDVDPGFRMAKQTEIDILKKEALEDVFEEKYEAASKDESHYFHILVESYTGNRDDTKLRDIVLRIHNFIQSQPDKEKWLKDVSDYYRIEELDRADVTGKLDDNIWVKTLKNEFARDLKSALELIDYAIDLCREPGGPEIYINTLENDRSKIETASEMLERGWDTFVDYMDQLKFDRIPSIKKDEKASMDEDIIKEVKDEIRNAIIKKQIIASITDITGFKNTQRHIDDLKLLLDISNNLSQLVLEFEAKYWDKKVENNILDFNDLEHLTLRALENEDISNIYKKKFEYIFTDEYQDSNVVQETIIDRIRRPNNLFMVGDVKQSIYKFRLADPGIFLKKYKEYSIDKSDKNKKIDLSQNFRSRNVILNGINFIFKSIMSLELGEMEYDKDAMLYEGIAFDNIEDDSIEINIINYSKESGESNEGDEAIEELEDIEVEALEITKKIKSLIGKETFSPKLGKTRPITYRDIVILSRSTRKVAQSLESIMTKEGIPVYSDSSDGYFESLEVLTILELLRVIDNPRNDLSLLTVMRSPIGKISISEITKIRSTAVAGMSIYENLHDYKSREDSSAENCDVKIKKKIVDLFEKIDRWSRESKYIPLDELLWKVMIESGYYYFVSSMPGGVQRQGNLKLLVDRATDLKSSSILGLGDFIDFMKKISMTNSDMGIATTIGEHENVVRIMSIHKSKGLEFPVVILCRTGKQFNMMDSKGDLIIHKSLGLGLKTVDTKLRTVSSTLSQYAIKKVIKKESLSEEMRILYVALTRAVDKLIIFATSKKLESDIKRWKRGNTYQNLVSSKSYIDWICESLWKEESIKNLDYESMFEKKIELDVNKSTWTLNFIEKNAIVLGVKEKRSNDLIKASLTDLKRSENFLEIDKRMNFKLEESNTISYSDSKISVSELKRRQEDDFEDVNLPQLIEKPEFLKEDLPITPAEKGTAMHYVLQNSEFSVDNVEEIKENVDKMRKRNQLSSAEYESIDYDKLVRFMKSNIAKRINKSPKVLKEKAFVFKKDNNLIQGIIDLYFFEGDEIVLLDYKTDYVDLKDMEGSANKYKEQLNYYKEALEAITGKRVKEKYIYFLSVSKLHRIGD